MGWFRKKITFDECAKELLKITFRIESRLSKEFNNNSYQSDEYEIRILAFWILSVSVPSNSIRDRVHELFTENLDPNSVDSFYNDIDIKYNAYFNAFGKVQNSPSRGHMLGALIADVVINGNPPSELPIVGDLEALCCYSIVMDTIKLCLEEIGRKKLADTIKQNM